MIFACQLHIIVINHIFRNKMKFSHMEVLFFPRIPQFQITNGSIGEKLV